MASADITYLCTIKESCKQNFTTYIDWSDHEKNKHTKLTRFFYCNGLDGCKAAFRDERTFGRHYEEMHPAHSLIADGYLLDRLYKRFWCGFCNMVVTTPEYSEHPEFFRACHIEGHLQGASDATENCQADPEAKNWVYLKVQ